MLVLPPKLGNVQDFNAQGFTLAAVEKIRLKQEHHISQEYMEFLLTNLNSDNNFSKLAIPSLDGIEFGDVENILHCQADRNYTIIYTLDGEH